ncbi:O-methyltransferase [Chondromyces apiculatus DSM 436]|uniref:O-methyltransferase n=2 Tax=Chondromyces apiculatus TaxID=51 RepID=A0A017TF79_9BACT|nr:class I SAM-dependent methyltransferase [Chondromyces apiculatus]EYF07271.1 O-methyltransferase [Chondromyces apiculatus DSM 436]
MNAMNSNSPRLVAMNSLEQGPVADTLRRLFQEAEAADGKLMEEHSARGGAPEDYVGELVESEKKDLRGTYRAFADHFLNVSPEFGRMLYLCARARNAQRIVEFGTSMGISAIHLAAALQDMGRGGTLIGTELEPGKVQRARANIEAAGLGERVEIREGDARDTLTQLPGEVDMVHLDGAFTLYMPILKLIEPHLKIGAMILAENAYEQAGDYLAYVRDPSSGYGSLPLPFEQWRGNEFTVYLGR